MSEPFFRGLENVQKFLMNETFLELRVKMLRFGSVLSLEPNFSPELNLNFSLKLQLYLNLLVFKAQANSCRTKSIPVSDKIQFCVGQIAI